MDLFSKIKERARKTASAWRFRQRVMRIDRADVLLAHRVVARKRFPSLRQWRMIGRVLTAPERKLIRYGAGFILLGAALGAASWMMTNSVFVPGNGGEYREGIVGSPRSPNPILAGSNDVDQDIVRLVYSGLYRRDEAGKLILDLASEARVSPDGKSYAFTLKEGVVFHDGHPFSSADVVFTVQAIQNPAWKSPLAPSLAGISVSAPDAKTAIFESEKPVAYLPSALTFGILPKHVWENITPSSHSLVEFNLKPIGTGPFKFDKFTRDHQGNILSYSLKAVRDPSAAEKNARLDTITLKFYGDYDTAIDKLNSNAVDGLNFVPAGKAAAIKSIPGLTIRTPAMSQYTAIFLNPKKNSALADPKIRQALAYAIDREKIVKEALGGVGVLRDQPIPDGAAGSTPNIGRYPFDSAQSVRLLDEAGYPLDQETGVRTKSETTKPKSSKEKPVTTKTELSLTLAAMDTESSLLAAQIVKDAWTALGIKTEIVAAPGSEIQKTIIRPREYDALLFGEILGADSDPYPFWHSSQITGGLNLSAYSNRRADELLEKARLAANEAERNGFLSEFQEILTKEEPAIFLYQPAYLYPQSEKIKGFSVAMMTAPADRFANVTDWYRKFKVTFK